MDLQEDYQKAIKFAGEKHAGQKITGSETSYLVHVSNVAMEIILASQHRHDFDVNFAVQVALLHDVLEDTATSFEEIKSAFGFQIADAVLALSKNPGLKPEEQIPDSLARIKLQPLEVWSVKLADRISNMQEPPAHWDRNKRIAYQLAARMILMQLKDANHYLEQRLEAKILAYDAFIGS